MRVEGGCQRKDTLVGVTDKTSRAVGGWNDGWAETQKHGYLFDWMQIHDTYLLHIFVFYLHFENFENW